MASIVSQTTKLDAFGGNTSNATHRHYVYTVKTTYADEIETISISMTRYGPNHSFGPNHRYGYDVSINRYLIKWQRLDGSLITSNVASNHIYCNDYKVGIVYFTNEGYCKVDGDALIVPFRRSTEELPAQLINTAVRSCLNDSVIKPYVKGKPGRPRTYGDDNEKKRRHREQALKSYYKRKAEKQQALPKRVAPE